MCKVTFIWIGIRNDEKQLPDAQFLQRSTEKLGTGSYSNCRTKISARNITGQRNNFFTQGQQSEPKILITKHA